MRGGRSRRGQALALAAVAALITSVTAFAPVYDRAMQQALVDTLLAHAGPDELTVRVRSEAAVVVSGQTEARDPRELADSVPRDVAARLGPPVLGRTAIVAPVSGDVPPSGELVWREGACEHVRVLSGACPDAPGEILVSEADADRFDLGTGATPTVGTAVDDRPTLRLEVVGTYAPRDEGWWQGRRLVGLSSVSRGPDPSAAHDAWLTSEVTFDEAPILTRETSEVGAVVRTAPLGVDELLALGDRVRAMARDVGRGGDEVHVQSDLDDLTADVRAQTRQAHRTVPLLMAPVGVLAVFALWLVLAAATEQRRGAVAVARLRGRRPAGAARLLVAELLPVLLVGVVVGAVAALAGGAVARALLPGSAPLEAGGGFVLAVLLAAVTVTLTTVAAALRVAREPLDSLVRGGRVASGRWALGVLDAFALASVGSGVLAFVTGSLRGPLALAGPALLALLAGLLLAHLVGPTAQAAGRWVLRRGRLVGGLTLLETGRRRDTRAVVAVVTVASALAVFAVDAAVVGERNRAETSEHEAGAPVVLRLSGGDLDGVREALAAADPSGRRATPVVVAGTTLAVEPEGFRRVALLPRGGPSEAQWRAIAAPESPPVVLTGRRVALGVRAAADLSVADALGSASRLDVGLVVSAATGTRRTVHLGTLPSAGARATLTGELTGCADGCRLAAVELTAPPGVEVDGALDLTGLRVDGRTVGWGAGVDDWNTTDDDHALIRPVGLDADRGLRLELSIRGVYPASVTPAWVPTRVAALLPDARRDPLGLEVTGLDGVDRPARDAGRVELVPTMPRQGALVDLDAISRGAEVTFDARTEVWLVDDPALIDAVEAALDERGIAVADVRRLATVRQAHDDTVAAWSLSLGAVLGPAVVLVALLILLVLAVTGWRERARDLAILRLNGAGRRTTRRLAVWAQVPAVVLAVLVGVGAGVLGAALALPDVAFFPTRPEVPAVDPSTAWGAVLAVAAACLVVLVAAAALAGRVVAARATPERVTEVGR